MIHVLHSLVTLNPDYGGPARSVPTLCNALKQYSKINVSLIATAKETEKNNLVSNKINFNQPTSKSYADFLQLGKEALTDNTIDVIHDHGIWLPNNLALAKIATRNDKPLIISTRGMLSPWALDHNWLKKKIGWFLYQKKILNQAVVIHATSDTELNDLRNLGLKNSIALIPNGIAMPEILPQKQESKHKTALFLSRLHPVKGLLTLIRAWSTLSPENWVLKIVGPNENNYKTVLEKEIIKLNAGSSITLSGSISDADKWQEYINADFFVLPSLSENFGIVIGEALACGTPVITTNDTPWQQIEDYQCGWCINRGEDALIKALDEAISLSKNQRQDMGKQGQKLIFEKYNWQDIANQMNAVYQWVLNKVSKPDCVIP